MPAEGRENPLLKKGNSDAFFREKYLTKNINAWYQQAEKLESGEITKEEYDQWRYTYPKMEAEQTRRELDALREKRKAENNTD